MTWTDTDGPKGDVSSNADHQILADKMVDSALCYRSIAAHNPDRQVPAANQERAATARIPPFAIAKESLNSESTNSVAGRQSPTPVRSNAS